MKPPFFLRLWISCVLFAALAPGAAAQGTAAAAASPVRTAASAEKLSLPGLPNAGKIGELLYRGAQPKSEGYTELKKLGVTTVLNLRDERKHIESERRKVEALGMRYVSIPTSGAHGPNHEQVAQFLEFLLQNRGQKIFVHCHYGADRTGVMIAAFRITQQNWTSQRAFDEMLSFHFHNFWHPGMADYVKQFPARFASEPAFAALRTSGPAGASSSQPD
jgi:protein tyrosine/serine phosphatase